MFVDSVKSLNCDVYFSLTQFNEPNVEKFIKEKNIKNFIETFQKNSHLEKNTRINICFQMH